MATPKKPAQKGPPARKTGSGQRPATTKGADKDKKVTAKPAAKAASRRQSRKPAVKQPAARQPAAKKPAAKKPATKQPATRRLAVKQPAAKKPGVKPPVAQRPPTKKPPTTKPPTTKPPTKKPPTTKPPTKKPPTTKPAAKKPAAPAKRRRGSVICPLSGFEVTPTTPSLGAKTVARLRTRLVDERERHLRQAEELAAEAEALALERDPGDTQFDEESGEGDTVNVERERDLMLSASARQIVEAVDRALTRIDAGTYGLCVPAGRRIALERLEAIPYAEECVDCKARAERRR